MKTTTDPDWSVPKFDSSAGPQGGDQRRETMSSNPLIPDGTVVHMESGEWNGLCSLLRAYADGEPERATAGTELEPDELARNYADYIEEGTEDAD